METTSIRRANESTTHATLGDNKATAQAPGSSTGSDGDECSFLAPSVAGNSIVHQRRRVNPESLALRLGPDLVRDLDALITPGNTEMPSFAVRKELQERYNIDRRHIYDYFHSRGLRVVKEDKHGNPITAKDLSTGSLPNLRPLRQAPVKNSRSHPYLVAERKLFKPRGVAKAKPGRPKKNPLVNPKAVPVSGKTNESNESADTSDIPVSEHSPVADLTPAYVAVNPLLPHAPLPSEDDRWTFNSVINPLDESFSINRAIGDIAYSYRHKLVFERMQELTEYPVKLALTDDRSISWNETSPCTRAASDQGLLLPHAELLTWDERQAIYKTVSDSLGPARGVQECQGTYRKHMEARTKLYFEGLLSVPCHSQQPSRTNTLLDRKPPLGTNEFRHWLSETRFLKHDGTNSSPRLRAGNRNAIQSVAKQQDIDGVTDQRYRQISIPHSIQTLDELFPTLGDNLNDITTDSPVVRTRDVTRVTTRALRGADECSAGVAESQLHGLSGFSATQEVKTRMPLADSRLVPCVTQYVALSDTQRRGRKMSDNPRKPQIRNPDRIWTRPVTSHDTRRRTPSAAGDL